MHIKKINEMPSGERNITADFVKGILILCVMYGHSISMINSLRGVSWTDSIVNLILTSFEMPLFIMISGYFLHFSVRKHSYGKTMWKRIIAIVIPLLVWEGIPAVFSFVQETNVEGFSKVNLLKIAYHCIWPGRLWFLGVYLYCSIIVILVEWICSKIRKEAIRKTCKGTLYTGIIVVLQFMKYPVVNLPFMFPYFLLGFWLAKYAILEKKKTLPAVCVLSVLFFVLIPFYKPELSLYLLTHISVNQITTQLPIFVYRFILNVCGCCAVYVSSWWICRKKQTSKLVTGISRIGKKTMEVYIISVYIQYLLRDLVGLVLKNTMVITDVSAPILWGPLFLIVMTVLCVFADKLLWRVPVLHRVLFGR